MIGWNNVSEMTKFGMPGVFTHGDFDTWSPGYLMFIAAHAQRHQPPVRNIRQRRCRYRGADAAAERLRAHLVQAESAAPADDLVAAQQQQLRADRSADVAALLRRESSAVPAQLLHQEQAVDPESEDRGAGRVCVPRRRSAAGRAGGPAARAAEAGRRDHASDGALHRCRCRRRKRGRSPRQRRRRARRSDAGGAGHRTNPPAAPTAIRNGRRRKDAKPQPTTRTFPAGSYIVRMDQPYSRIADSLLDYQYWSPNDPQRTPYDDTGWTFPELFNVQAARITDVTVLDAAAEKVSTIGGNGSVTDAGSIYLLNHTADNALITLRYRFKDAVVRGRGRAVRGRRQEVRARIVHRARTSRRPTCRRPRPNSVCASQPSPPRPPSRRMRCARRASRFSIRGRRRRPRAGGGRHSISPRCRSPTSARRTWRLTRISAASSTSSSFRRSAAAPKPSSTACRCGATRCRGRRPR